MKIDFVLSTGFDFFPEYSWTFWLYEPQNTFFCLSHFESSNVLIYERGLGIKKKRGRSQIGHVLTE